MNDNTNKSQLVIIGAGPGGYAAAFLAADFGLQVTLIDRDINPGGVCLNRGCIPSKALLHAAKILSESKSATNFGITFGEPKIDLDKLRDWKNSVVTKLTNGLSYLCKQRKVTFIQGRVSFLDSNTIKIRKNDTSEEIITFEKAIIATGSKPSQMPNAPSSEKILNSTTALDIINIPKSLLVIGGGYIGLELGTVYNELGSEVSVVEMTEGLLPGADKDLTNILFRRLKTCFKEIYLNTKVIALKESKNGIAVTFQDKNGDKNSYEYEKVLISIGRKPYSEHLDLEKTKVKLDEKGFIKVNAQRQTGDPNIYAIGDITGEPMLAHKASREGRVAVESIKGQESEFLPHAIPAVVYTNPEIAWCGLTELEAKKNNVDIKVVKFPWGASGRAITLDRTDGLTKLIIDPQTEKILGVAIAGVGAGDLISEGVFAMNMGAVAEDVKLTIHPHPTLSETIMETAESFFGLSTHIYNPKK